MSDVQEKLSPDYVLLLAGDHQALWLKYKKLFRRWTEPVSYTMEPEDLEQECYLFFRKRWAEIDCDKILRPDTWELKAVMYLPFKSLNKHLHSVYHRSGAHERISYDELSRTDDEPTRGVLHRVASEAYSPETLLFQPGGAVYHEGLESMKRCHMGDEATVLGLLYRGMSPTEISREIGLPVKTVKDCLRDAREKMCQHLGIDLPREERISRLHEQKFQEASRLQRQLRKKTITVRAVWNRTEERRLETQRWVGLGSTVHA